MDFGIDYALFHLKKNYFDHQSTIHGINHTYRVMYHVLQIAAARGLKREGATAFCAAYIHDLARLHDGYCDKHGAWATENKLGLYTNLFYQIGLNDEDLEEVEIAVTNHSIPKELEKEDKGYTVTAILKDADALDRIRLGEQGLDIRYLRFHESKKMVSRAEDIFYATDGKNFSGFTEILQYIKDVE